MKRRALRTDKSYSAGFVQNRDVARVIGQFDMVMEGGGGASLALKWIRTKNDWTRATVDFTAIRIWAYEKPEVKVFLVSPEGEVLAATAKGEEQEQIAPGQEGPERYGEIMDMRHIGKHLYVCGMGRQVYRREGKGRWEHRDQGVLNAPSTKSVNGFTSIDGLSEDDFYAVGFGGEIFQCKKGKWRQIDSPTNLVLNKVRAVNPELVFACGQKGVLLKGADTRWQALKHNGPKDEFFDLEWYGDRLYVAAADALYRLEAKDRLVPVDTGLTDGTYGHLHANDGVLWSFGTKHILYTEDGVTWHDATPK